MNSIIAYGVTYFLMFTCDAIDLDSVHSLYNFIFNLKNHLLVVMLHNFT